MADYPPTGAGPTRRRARPARSHHPLRTRDAGFLDGDTKARYEPRARTAAQWLVDNVTADSVAAGGLFAVTGKTELRSPDNGAWMLALTLEALTMLQSPDPLG